MKTFAFFTWLWVSTIFTLGLVTGESTTDKHPDSQRDFAAAVQDTTNLVTMSNSLNFAPDTLVIQAGETVTWKNTSLLVHTVTADPEQATKDKSVRLPDGAKPFHSGRLKPEQSFSYTFTKTGTYTYFCVPHEAMMRGTIIVKSQN